MRLDLNQSSRAAERYYAISVMKEFMTTQASNTLARNPTLAGLFISSVGSLGFGLSACSFACQTFGAQLSGQVARRLLLSAIIYEGLRSVLTLAKEALGPVFVC
jgi:hypothetical protein